jgi:membrane protease YdiL (CAAX protease family)
VESPGIADGDRCKYIPANRTDECESGAEFKLGILAAAAKIVNEGELCEDWEDRQISLRFGEPNDRLTDLDLPENMSNSSHKLVAIAFAFEAGLGLLAVLVGRGLGCDPLLTLGYDKPVGQLAIACLWGALAAIPLLIAFLFLDRHPHMLVEFKKMISSTVAPMFEGLSIVEVAAISVAAGLGEELLFRGLMQTGLQGWIGEPYGWAMALVVASIAFGVCHWLNATYAAIVTVIGFCMGGLFVLVDDLAAPIVAHAVFDFAAILYLTRDARWPRDS